MSCCIPGCCNRHVQWTTPLPRDDFLLTRWNAAIRAGTGLSISEAQICNAHFADLNLTDYLEPTLFHRNNVQTQVRWCRLCLRHDCMENMFEINERRRDGGHSLAWIANKHFGVWMHSDDPTEKQFFCKKCKVRLEATNNFWQEIQQAAEQYQILLEKMAVQKKTFQKLEPENSSTQFMDGSKEKDAFEEGQSFQEFPFLSDEELDEKLEPLKIDSSVPMFAVVEFVESSTKKVVAVPTAWLKDELLMWPKLEHGQMLDRMREDSFLFDDSVEYDEVPVLVLQKYEQFNAAEAAAQAVLRRRNPDLKNKMNSTEPLSPAPKDILTYQLFRNEIQVLKRELNTLVQNTIDAASERSFRKKLNRIYSVVGEHSRTQRNATATELPMDQETCTIEKHKKINNEEELDEWNDRLTDPSIYQGYLEQFSKIIIPNSCPRKGNNALYTIVDYLFTRDFWNHFTWTGISRGKKSDRGFREFSNVTNLMLDIVRRGDPTYDAAKLEAFCRGRLFRYCKARSARQQLRRSSCRQRRKIPSVDRRTVNSSGEQMYNFSTHAGCNEETMAFKIEVDSDDMWRQSEDTNADQNSDSMM